MIPQPVLGADIGEILTALFGHPIQLLSYQKLNRQEAVHVARMTLSPSPYRPDSVIVKHLHPDRYPPQRAEDLLPEFIEEAFTYQFLSKLSFDLCPRLLGGRQGLLILEDLGQNSYNYPNEAALLESVAATFAKFHAATADHYALFKKMRQEAQLDEIDRRRYSADRYHSLFASGAQQIKSHGQALNIDLSGYDQTINQVQDHIRHPGPFLALIHDDLASRRQSVNIDGKFYLLDFEHAKYSHALLDICKVLVGKIERQVSTDRYFINHPNLPIDFAQAYRRKIELYRQVSYDDTLWNIALSSALIYSTLSVLGDLLNISSTYPIKPLRSFTQNLGRLMTRLLLLLEGNDTHAALKRIVERLSQCIYL